MDRLDWSDKLSVGVKLVDDQHKELISMYNSFLDACEMPDTEQSIIETLKFLEEYIFHHFAAEEQLMTESNFPGTEDHRSEHKRFFREVIKLGSALNANNLDSICTEKLKKFLRSWLVGHVHNYDRELGDYLRTEKHHCDTIGETV